MVACLPDADRLSNSTHCYSSENIQILFEASYLKINRVNFGRRLRSEMG